MDEAHTRFTELSTAIREYSLKPVSTDTPNLGPLVDDFIQAVAGLDTASPKNATPLSETGLNLYRILQSTKDTNTIKSCLRGLLRAGRFGRILAARYVHGKGVSLRELAAMVGSIPAEDRLALGHEMLVDYPGDHDKQTISWLEGLMKPLAGTAPQELSPFVASLGKMGETLAFPARQVLMSGLFGEWLTKTLETGASGEDLETLSHIVSAMDDPAHAKTLAVSIKIGFISATPLALRTIAEVAEARDKDILDMFLKVLKSANRELGGPSLDGIIAQQSPASGKLLATIRMKMPSLKKAAATRVPLLGDTAYTSYLAALPREHREKAESEAFAALLAIAPDFVESLTRMGTAMGTKPEPAPENGASSHAAEIDNTACPKPGFFAKIFGPRKKTLEKILPKFRNFRDMDLTCSNVENEELDGRELITLNLAYSTFTNVHLLRSRMTTCNLVGSNFTDGTHTGSTFNTNNFSGTDFTNVTFVKCSFNDCNFTGAAFSNCTFSDCRFRNCLLGGSAFLAAKMRQVGVTTSVMAGVSFYETNARSCRFEDVDLSGAEFTSTDLNGVEFINSVINAATITNSTFHSMDMPGTSVNHCRIINSDLPHALFLDNRVRQFPQLASNAEQAPLPDPHIIPPEAATKVLRAWSREMTFFRREERMQAFNRSRLSRAITSIERDKQVYLRIMTHLLNTDVFEKKFDLKGVPSCEVWGYTPSLSTLELAKQFFTSHKPSRRNATVRILAVYAMGSLGTVAQTAKSDIDCWVCYDGDLDLDAEVGLKRKLDALGLWAESEFGLEAHFFPMRMDDVRANIFSAGDEESSGSAQALLLKEEFYRTALRIAGKHLAWWVTPPGADKQSYDKCIQAARRYPLTGRPRLEDFGHLAPVPPDEYFGGSLWQMVKAVHSPFKSVLKLGLLESYADPKTSNLPLCDRIKHNLFLHKRGVRRTDPYATLFSTLRAYYAKRGDNAAAKLLTESFTFKANLCDIPFFMNLPARYEDASLIEAMFGKGYVDPDKVCNSNVTWSFDKSLHMGSAVRHFMVNTYQRIQGTLTEDGATETLINSEDLTRMGRRIGANFSKKKHKIMRVPFMDTSGDGFPILHLTAEKAPGKKPIWVVRGGSPDEAKKSADSLQLLHRSGDPAVMLTWLLANRIYNPKSLLQADRTIAPLSVADLQKLMPAMYEFFPFDETFERDINEGLEAERVTRVFMIFNLTAATETKKVERVAVIYTTNWGEMYCRTFTNPGKEFEEFPSRFLAKHLEQPVADVPNMILFIPKGSQCKRINLI